MESKVCPQCGLEIKLEKRIFCSNKCRIKRLKEQGQKTKKIKEQVKCKNCGKSLTYDVRTSRHNNEFCNRKCRFEWMKNKTLKEIYGEEKAKIISENHIKGGQQKSLRSIVKVVPCEYCGKEVKIYKNDLTTLHNFCSRGCVNNWKKGKTYEKIYGEEKAKIYREKQHKPKKVFTKECLTCKKLIPDYKVYCCIDCYNKNRKGKTHRFFGRRHPKNFENSHIELKIKNFLIDKKINFKSHITTLPGRPDFVINNIIIFADGCYWHKCPKCFPKENGKELDDKINEKLTKMGYTVLRFWEHDIDKRFDIVREKILNTLGEKIDFKRIVEFVK